MPVNFDKHIEEIAAWTAKREVQRAKAGANGYEIIEIVRGLGEHALLAAGLWNGEPSNPRITASGELVTTSEGSALVDITEQGGLGLQKVKQLFDFMDGGCTDLRADKYQAFDQERKLTAYTIGRKILTYLRNPQK